MISFILGLTKGTYGEVIEKVEDYEVLNLVMNIWGQTVFPRLRLWEFYVIDVKEAKIAFEREWKKKFVSECVMREGKGLSLIEQAQILVDDALGYKRRDGSRFDKIIDMEKACVFVRGIVGDSGVGHELLSKLVDEINLLFYKEFDFDTAIINDQIMGRYIGLYSYF